MRGLLYISEATTPSERTWFNSDFASIAEAAKTWNAENQVTGFLTYYDGFFMQYLEGELPVIAELTDKVFSDSRHKQLRVLLDRSIDSRTFDDSRARLIGDLKKDKKFNQFLNRFYDEFFVESKEDESLASTFGVPINTLYMCG